MEISLLSTIVDMSDVYDWKKINGVITWLKKIYDVRIIGCNNLNSLFTWVDVSYAVWENMMNHDGRFMYMGQKIIHASLAINDLTTKVQQKQNLEE